MVLSVNACLLGVSRGEQPRHDVGAAMTWPRPGPRSIAVVGAGTKPGSAGRAVLRSLSRAGFAGLLHAVDPHAQAVERPPCHPSVTSLPQPPELAVVAVPRVPCPRRSRNAARPGAGAGGADLRFGCRAGGGAACHGTAFMAALPQQALDAYEDQCAPTNPRMSILLDIEDIMRAAFYAEPHPMPSAQAPSSPVRTDRLSASGG
ncbi:CoA-binding protein [Streptomyces sp. SCSIO 30461]|uniref:CoA-binding protein n=1 Tax=Streptomyces sp. SCSIO 30461 TaxID=3118085 RepID=UPI0030CF91B3